MEERRSAEPSRRAYVRARWLLLAIGLSVLALVALLTYLRRVEPVEVWATLLFIPIFVALVFWSLPGGLVAGAIASLVYAALRFPAVDAVGVGDFAGLLISRTVAFVAFGGIGGWASRQLERSLVKLDLYDQVDDATGLFNARFFLQDTDLETSRSTRYRTIYSVVAVDIPSDPLERLSRRRRDRALRDLGRGIRESVRAVDRAVHASGDRRDLLAVILPETGEEGARVFAERLASRVGGFLAERGARVGDGIRTEVATLPGGEAVLESLRARFAAIEAAEHPASAHAAAS